MSDCTGLSFHGTQRTPDARHDVFTACHERVRIETTNDDAVNARVYGTF